MCVSMSISTGAVEQRLAQPGHMAAHDRLIVEQDEYEYASHTSTHFQLVRGRMQHTDGVAAMSPFHRTSVWRPICAQAPSRELL